MRKTSLFGLFSFVLGISLVGQVPGAKEQENFQKTFNISPRGVISLDNVNGSVVIKSWDEAKVDVKAIKTGPSQDKLDLVKIDIKSQADRLDIDTDYPKEIRNLNVSVRYEITVPRTANLNSIQTVNGSVEITGVQGTIETQTVNGSINVIGGNTVSAETVNGSITATLLSINSSENAKFATVNGSINLALPNSLDADLDAKTLNGKITSDLPLSISTDKSNPSGIKRLKGKIGRGGPKLSLETVNGSIILSEGEGKEL